MIAVGDSGSVELIFHSTAGQKGRIAKSATVKCNDAERGTFMLKLSSTVYDREFPDSLKPVTLSASRLVWEPLSKAKEQKLFVTNTAATPVRMKLVSQPYGFATIDVADGEIKQGKAKEIKVKIDKNFTGAEFKKSFTVELSDSAKTRFTVPVVFGEPEAPAVARPAPGKKVPFVDTTTAGATTKPVGKK